MNKNIALIVSGLLFLFIAIVHLVRLYLQVEIVVSGHILPMQASIYGFVITLALSIWMFAASRSE